MRLFASRCVCIALCFIFLIAASGCAANPAPPVDSRAAPTPPPPPWVDSSAAIALDNIAAIQYLGRLDADSIPSTIFAHALSPDGTRLAGLNNEQLIVWDLITGSIVFSTGRAGAVQVFFSPEKTEVYTLSIDGSGVIRDAETGAQNNSFSAIDDHNGVVAFDPENGWLAVGSLGGDVRIWDPVERRAVATLEAHRLQITALAFSADGERLATAGEEGSVKVWNWRTRELMTTFEDEAAALSLSFSPDGAQLAAGKGQDTRLWPLSEEQPELSLDTGAGGIEVLRYSPDSQYLLSGGAGVPDMSLWSAADGRLAAKLPGVGGDRVSAAFSPDGSLVVTSALSGSASLWNLSSIRGQSLERADLDTRGAAILAVDWSADNRLITLFGALTSVYLWGIGPETNS